MPVIKAYTYNKVLQNVAEKLNIARLNPRATPNWIIRITIKETGFINKSPKAVPCKTERYTPYAVAAVIAKEIPIREKIPERCCSKESINWPFWS